LTAGAQAVPRIESGLTSVVIVVANSGPLVGQCVARALASSAPVEVMLVDNASVDGEAEAAMARHRDDPRLRVLRNPFNRGFGPACNQGAAQASGDALLFLNPDCLIEIDTVAQLRDLAGRHPRAGIIGVHVLQADGQPERAIRRRDPSLRRALMSLSGLARFETRWPSFAGVELPPAPSLRNPEPVEAVSGACLFLPRAAFDAIDGFDEGYFLHCEDLDLCRRTRDGGRDVLFAPSIPARHEQGSSSHRRPLFVARHKHRGMWRYFRKFDPAARNPLLSALVWCGIWAHYALLLPVNAWRQMRSRTA
jgi:GT2 family glycosyltransferase